jgi:hypothetical protein
MVIKNQDLLQSAWTFHHGRPNIHLFLAHKFQQNDQKVRDIEAKKFRDYVMAAVLPTNHVYANNPDHLDHMKAHKNHLSFRFRNATTYTERHNIAKEARAFIAKGYTDY